MSLLSETFVGLLSVTMLFLGTGMFLFMLLMLFKASNCITDPECGNE